jgi:hypothetical protein
MTSSTTGGYQPNNSAVIDCMGWPGGDQNALDRCSDCSACDVGLGLQPGLAQEEKGKG